MEEIIDKNKTIETKEEIKKKKTIYHLWFYHYKNISLFYYL